MSFNKKEFLARVLEALEIVINEYFEDMAKDDNLDKVIADEPKRKTTTYEFTDDELEKSFRKYVLKESLEQQAMPSKYTFNGSPEICSFINELWYIARKAATKHAAEIDVKECLFVAKKHIAAVSKVLKCKAGKDSFIYLINTLRQMINETVEGLPEIKLVAQAVVDFLKNEDLLYGGEIKSSNPVEYVWYKKCQSCNSCE
jgi:hypothetical protein